MENEYKYYFEPVKIVRDLVHEYINLTKFDLKIIDTIYFQRLINIRQLTCQNVYPAARHTRYEHSLGVLELTRQAIKRLNANGFINGQSDDSNKNNTNPIISKNLEFNASLAALLHDVGHSPFSHMGELEFDKEEVRKELEIQIVGKSQLDKSEDVVILNKVQEKLKKSKDLIEEIQNPESKKIGSVHEQLSCCVILENFGETLSNVEFKYNRELIEVDFEFIIRCIIGFEYNVSTLELNEKNKCKNAIVRLINSNIFDMDKLDYIIRDSFFAGIGTPYIDTKRLFRNMYFDNKYSLIFKSKAVPVLQNMIEARDGLYMYVYNHHVSVFSDFMNAYILRRLKHNTEKYKDILLSTLQPEKNADEIDVEIFSLGLIPNSYLFNPRGILDNHYSDCDWISILNMINNNKDNKRAISEDSNEIKDKDKNKEERKNYIKHILNEEAPNKISIHGVEKLDETQCKKIDDLAESIINTYKLINDFLNRRYLKPWWKTVFEFNSFVKHNFQDDTIRKTLQKNICKDGEYKLESAEFRSQIVKHTRYVATELRKKAKECKVLEDFEDGDIFVIQRPTSFFAIESIEKLHIALNPNEMIPQENYIKYSQNEYFTQPLTEVIPQKNYSSIYAKEGFYVFSKQLTEEQLTEDDNLKKKLHHKEIERIFICVCEYLAGMEEQAFVNKFQNYNNIDRLEFKSIIKDNEHKSNSFIFNKYCTLYGIKLRKEENK